MSLAPIVATPQLYTADALKAAIDIDLQARGIPCAVQIGDRDPELERGEPQCWILFGDETIGEPAGHYQPGAWWIVTGTVTPLAVTLDPASTITPTLTGDPNSSGNVLVTITTGGTTGAGSLIVYTLSLDGGATSDTFPLGDRPTIQILGMVLDLGSGKVATTGDSIAFTATAEAAAPLLDDAATYLLRIHAPAKPGQDTGAAEAQRATKALMQAVCAAVKRAHEAPLRQPWRARWPRRIEGYPAFVWGSLVEVSLVIAAPILGDKRPLETATQLQTTPSYVFPG